MTTQTIKHLKKEIKEVGMSWAGVQPLLPDWWEEVSAYPAGIVELRGFIAKYLGLKIDKNQGILLLNDQLKAVFKTRKNTVSVKLSPNRSVVASVARQVAFATSIPWKNTVPQTAIALRHIILAQGRPWVGFNDLVERCWQHGIPVLCLPKLPFPCKMDGLAIFCLGRPVIVINKNPDRPGWALFVLAHEIGHLALGHLANEEGCTIMDETISENEINDEEQERSANQYAITLLTGGTRYMPAQSGYKNSKVLARNAIDYGREHKIDPAHLVLNAAHASYSKDRKNPYPLANKILDEIDSNQTASIICRQTLEKYVDLKQLPYESVAFLERLGLIKKAG